MDTYDELKNISYVFYIDNNDGKLHMANLSDKVEVDAHNYPIYKGRYGNCLITLKHQKTTDKLYLITEETFGKIKKEFWKLDRYIVKEFLDCHADKIIVR